MFSSNIYVLLQTIGVQDAHIILQSYRVEKFLNIYVALSLLAIQNEFKCKIIRLTIHYEYLYALLK